MLLSNTVDECGDRGAAFDAVALMRSFDIVEEVVVEDALHLVHGLKTGAAALDAEMLVMTTHILDVAERMADRIADSTAGPCPDPVIAPLARGGRCVRPFAISPKRA
jgi:hypothetical protein